MKKLIILLFYLSLLTAKPCFSEEPSDYFDDVLLIINFNHPYYKNIEFFEEIYRPHFKNIVYYGEESHPKVNKIAHNQGWYLHRVVANAMSKWPNYKGYIFCQDDCFMNFWNFNRLDKDKIWFHPFWSGSLKNPKSDWPWWNYSCGYEAVKKAVEKLPKKNRSTLFNNCKQNHAPVAWGDFFYVPGRMRDSAVVLSLCFENPNVFLELGIPTLLLSLDSYNNMEHLNPNWGGTIQSVDHSQFDDAYDWIHPIKFSDPANREFIRSILETKNNNL